jgi:hypothetical protein
MGCGYGQGFGVARSMGAAGVEAMLRTPGGPGDGMAGGPGDDMAGEPGGHQDEPSVSECETTRVSG